MPDTSRSPPVRKRPRWTRRRVGVALLLTTLVATAAIAGVILRQDVATSAAAVTPDVVFANGNDYAAINSAGFATLTIGTSETSASLTVNGVPGAADLQLVDLLKLTNQDGTQGYNVTLARSTTLDASISEFTVHVLDSGDTEIVAWDASAAATSSTFSLPASTTYDITIDMVVNDGTAVGSLGSFDMQFSMTPA